MTSGIMDDDMPDDIRRKRRRKPMEKKKGEIENPPLYGREGEFYLGSDAPST